MRTPKRRGNIWSATAAEWAYYGTMVLPSGALGVETDTGRQKIGTGTAAWSSLSYATGASAGITATQVDQYIAGAFAAPVAEDTPTITYSTSWTTSMSGTPVSVKPRICGGGSKVSGWDGQDDTHMRWSSGVYETLNGANSDLGVVGSTKPQGDAQAAGWHYFVTFETAAPKIEIMCYSTSTTDTFWLRVNGRWVNETTPSRSGAVGNGYMATITFPSTKPRTITLACTQYGGLAQIRVPAGHGVFRPLGTPKNRIAIVGDSYVNGSGTYASNNGAAQLETFAHRLGHLMGADDLVLAGIGGTGWVAGTNGAASSAYGTRLDAVLGFNPGTIVFYGSVNDQTSSTADVAAALDAGLARCASVPTVYVVGPILTSWTANNEAMKAVTAARGRKFVDVNGIIRGTGKTGATTGDGNADQFLLNDGIHPTWDAHKMIASCIYRGMVGV